MTSGFRKMKFMEDSPQCLCFSKFAELTPEKEGAEGELSSRCCFWGFWNLPNFPCMCPSQSSYCSKNDGGKGQRNNGLYPGQSKIPQGECKAAAEQYQSR